LKNFLSYYADNIAVFSRLFPDTQQTLTRLRKRGARLAVVTNKYTDLTHSVLKQLDLIEHFDTIVCSETTPNPKPGPDPALFACKVLGVTPREALFVGDASPDVGCARAAGCPVVVLRDGYNNGTPAAQLGADAVIASIAELA
jgi:phosphoglycolate phosphatase